MAVSFSEFGKNDVKLYREYLSALATTKPSFLSARAEEEWVRTYPRVLELIRVPCGGLGEDADRLLRDGRDGRAVDGAGVFLGGFVEAGIIDGGGDEASAPGDRGAHGVDSTECSNGFVQSMGGVGEGCLRRDGGLDQPLDESGTRCGVRLPRGPNYERNQANRLRKKAVKAARAAGLRVTGGDGKEAGISGATSANWRSGVESESVRKGRFADLGEEVQKELVETQAARLIMENKAKIKEYREREQKQKHGIHHLNEVMRMLRLVKECKKMTDLDPKLKAVVGWAETVASNSSESISRASPVGSVGSLKSVESKVSSKSSVSVVDNSFTLGAMPMNRTEEFLSRNCGVTAKTLVAWRKKKGRQIFLDDCTTRVQPVIKLKDWMKADLVDFIAEDR